MAKKVPGKSYRDGVTVMHMAVMFATEEKAVEWFEGLHWPDGEMCCLRCGSADGAYRVKSGKPMPYRCKDCKQYFSLKTGTAMESSKLSLRLWAWAIYLEMTSLKGVSSMKLHRDLGVRQATAWFMLHRIREAFSDIAGGFTGPVEVGGRGVLLRQAQEHVECEAARAGWHRAGSGGQDGGSGREGPGDKSGGGTGHRAHGQGDATGLRRQPRNPGSDALHGRRHGLQGDRTAARSGEAQRGRVRPWAGPHQRRRKLLVDAQARPQGRLPQAQREAPANAT